MFDVFNQVGLTQILFIWEQQRGEFQWSDKVYSRKTIFRGFKLKMIQKNIYFMGIQEGIS